MTEVEKALLALWVACAVLQVPHAHTIAVTRVLEAVEPRGADSHAHPAEATGDTNPAVQRATTDEQGWQRWAAIGACVPQPMLTEWIAALRTTLDADGRLPVSEYGSRNAETAALVKLAIRRSVDADWPLGRAVTASDLKTLAANDAVMHRLLQHITSGGTSLG